MVSQGVFVLPFGGRRIRLGAGEVVRRTPFGVIHKDIVVAVFFDAVEVGIVARCKDVEVPVEHWQEQDVFTINRFRASRVLPITLELAGQITSNKVSSNQTSSYLSSPIKNR